MIPTPGETAYNAYCEERNWKSFNREPLPKFNDQSEGLKYAWEAAAKSVIKQHFNNIINEYLAKIKSEAK